MRAIKWRAVLESAAAVFANNRGRPAVLGSALLASAFVIPPSAVRAEETTIVAVIDQARLVKIPPGTETLVIGNPTVADVTLLKQNSMMILTPRSFGQTNFIALDGHGNAVAQSVIEVVAGTNTMIVQRGTARESYSCAPRCQPTEQLGDDDGYVRKNADQAQAHTARLSGSTAPTSLGVLTPSH